MNNHRVHVAVAVILHPNKDKILLAKRPDDKHQGGKWEFPGGKVEADEGIESALARELLEEVGIKVEQAKPLIQIHHDYADKAVYLDVWEITQFSGKPEGVEGQQIKWVDKSALENYDFPAANYPILRAIELPETCLITPDPASEADFLGGLDSSLKKGVSLVLFRAKSLKPDAYNALAQQAIQQAHNNCARVVLNSPPLLLDEADGLHLTSTQLMRSSQRPVLKDHQTLSASCHTLDELKQAEKLRADFVFLSPVKQTRSHPDAHAIGWQQFSSDVQAINIPVYALGGLGRNDISDARQHGAQGIAAITQLWEK